jgi:hypothetical protein
MEMAAEEIRIGSVRRLFHRPECCAGVLDFGLVFVSYFRKYGNVYFQTCERPDVWKHAGNL